MGLAFCERLRLSIVFDRSSQGRSRSLAIVFVCKGRCSRTGKGRIQALTCVGSDQSSVLRTKRPWALSCGLKATVRLDLRATMKCFFKLSDKPFSLAENQLSANTSVAQAILLARSICRSNWFLLTSLLRLVCRSRNRYALTHRPPATDITGLIDAIEQAFDGTVFL